MSTFAADPVLDESDKQAIALSLRAIKMTTRDTGFKKDLIDSEFILPQTREILQRPMALPEFGQTEMSHLRSIKTLTQLAEIYPVQMRVCGIPVTPPDVAADGEYSQLPKPLAKAVTIIRNAASSSRKNFDLALTNGQDAALAAFGVETLHLNRDSGEMESWQKLGIDLTKARNFIARDKALENADDELAEPILAAGDRFEAHRLADAAVKVVAAVDQAIQILKDGKNDPEMQKDFQIEFDSSLGKIICGGAGANTYTNEAFLIIDAGGDDTYLNSAGGANGLLGRPISIAIDLGGSDQFISRRSFSQGSGVFGIGILAALGSNCTFQAKHISQGAGFFGCGILMTGPGHHTFEAHTFGQGAAIFGTGMLWQRGGDTSYRAAELAQGFGGTQGIGLLLDEDGNDNYVAGGVYPCGWLAGHHFSLSQGFGYGMRPFAGGGMGILCDLKGNDHYQADVYGQGASYWYSLGLLLDAEGNDTYDAHQYCQGAGIHISAGALIDGGGNDTYTAGHICQGAAHDYSVGMLIDRGGNDKYTGETTAQGAAINNSFAMLLDHSGDDTYTGTDPKQSQATGHNGDKREYGSIGLLTDLGGHDVYSQGQSNNVVWLKPLYGSGLDGEAAQFALSPTTPVAEPPLTSVIVPHRPWHIDPVDPHHPMEQLFRRYMREPENAAEGKDTAAAAAEFKQRAPEVLAYLLTRTDSPNIMIRVKAEELVDQLSSNAIPILIDALKNPRNDEVARVSCYFLARFNEKAQAGIPQVLPLLKREKILPTVLYTLGHLRAKEGYRPALDLLNEPREAVRLRSTQLLGRLGDPRATGKLIHQLDDDIYDVRYAAEDALVLIGKQSLKPLHNAYDKASAKARPHILEALAKLGDERSLKLAGKFYQDENPLVRTAVMKSLTHTLDLALHPLPPAK